MLTIILLLILGNSFSIIFTQTILGKVSLLIIFIYACILFLKKQTLKKQNSKVICILLFLLISKLVFSKYDTTELGYLIKIFSMYVICNYFNSKKILYKLDSIIYFLSSFSLVFFILINTKNQNLINLFKFKINNYSSWLFMYGYQNNRIDQNAGFAWEPSIYASIIGIFLFYNLVFHKNKFKNNIKILIYILTILTTKSTSGLLILLVNCIYYFFNNINKTNLLVLIISIFLFVSLDFDKKVIHKIISRNQVKGNYSGQARNMHVKIDLELFKNNKILGSNNLIRERKEIAELFSKKNKIIKKFFELKKEYMISSNTLTSVLGKYGILIFIINIYLYIKLIFKKKNMENTCFILILFITFLSQNVLFYPFYMIFWYLPKNIFIKKNILKGDMNENSYSRNRICRII